MRGLTFVTGVAMALGVIGCEGSALAAACGSAYVVGDVFASVGNSTVNVYQPNGSLVCTMNDASGTTYTTGSGFDKFGNFYVTNFGVGTISKFNNSGTLINSAFMTSNNTPESIVNVSVGPLAGTSFVGGPNAVAGAPVINQYNTATGALMNSYTVAPGNGSTGGTDWVDFKNDHVTVIYDSEGTIIKSYNIQTSTQNADFGTAPVYGYAMRVIPFGAFAGDVLRADSTEANMFDANGNLIKTYSLPGQQGDDFALNLDPNGLDFWTSDSVSGTVWEINIATGAIDEQWLTGVPGLTFGMAVYGEITSSSVTTPEPATLAILGFGLVGTGFARRLRRR
jgi:hypothetical protein